MRSSLGDGVTLVGVQEKAAPRLGQHCDDVN